MKAIFPICILVFSNCNLEQPNSKLDIPSCAYDDSIQDTLTAVRIIENFKVEECIDQQLIIDACWCANKFKLYKDQIRLSNFISPLDAITAANKATLLMEGYRGMQNLDSSMHYSEVVQSYDLDTSKCLFNKVQITFELKNWQKSLEYSYEGTALKETKTIIDSRLFERYIVQNLCMLDRYEEACDYAQREVPEYFETMKDSICNEAFRTEWLKRSKD